MQLSNRAIAERFERLAALLEIEGENPFRVRAYRNAAETIAGLGTRLEAQVAQQVDLTQYAGIGREIADKIATLVHTGTLPALDAVCQRVPAELADLMRIEGLGPRGVKALYEHFDLRSLDELERVANAGRVRELSGFGARKEAALLDGIQRLRAAGEERRRLDTASALAEPLQDWLAAHPATQASAIAGSYRRRRETVGDIDILIATADGAGVMQRLMDYTEVERVLSHGSTRSSVNLAGGLQVDVRAVDPTSFGAALLYFTGSQAHNVALRQRVAARGWKLNEYGLFNGDTLLAGRTEAAIYAELALAWIPPELREDRGEIEAAASGRLPDLVPVEAIRGNLHGHTTWSDGKASLEEMVQAARERGHGYMAITDHGPRVTVANGLSPERLRAQGEAIDALAGELHDLTLFKGCEVDILADGALDLPDAVLAQLDIVVCSIHYNLRQSRAQQTERVLRAMDNPHFMIWGHPTAREINQRDPIDIDLDRCLEAAAARGIAVEINAQPKRLDLSDGHARLALDKGCRLVINTDAHASANLDLMAYGVDQARRAGATDADILNTLEANELRAALRARP
jgi:DNA polymerase (family 10)